MHTLKIGFATLAIALFVNVGVTHAAGLTDAQIQAILGLLNSFGAEASVVANVEATLKGKPVTGGTVSTSNTTTTNTTTNTTTTTTPPSGDRCSYVKSLVNTLYEGVYDSTTSGEVTLLQKFLAADVSLYPEGKVTGYFGPATRAAVERWQAAQGVASKGMTGFGVVGPATRAALAKCGGQTVSAATVTPPVTPQVSLAAPIAAFSSTSRLSVGDVKVIAPQDGSANVGSAVTVRYVIGPNIVASDPAIVERSIVNANTGAVVAGFEPLTQSAGTYSFDFVPREPGMYQAFLRTTLDSIQYPARSGVVTVTGSPLGVSNMPAPVVVIDASPPVIPKGETSTLLWSTKNANRCLLKYGTSEEKVEVNGSRKVTPSETTTYLVWCTYDIEGGQRGPAASGTVTLTTTSVYQ